MNNEKPLHVRVAEALECRLAVYELVDRITYECGCVPDRAEEHTNLRRYPHGQDGVTDDGERYGSSMLKPYGEDSPEGWACTGPLVERFRVNLVCIDQPGRAMFWHACWGHDGDVTPHIHKEELSACGAAAEFILALEEGGLLAVLLGRGPAEAGRLPR